MVHLYLYSLATLFFFVSVSLSSSIPSNQTSNFFVGVYKVSSKTEYIPYPIGVCSQRGALTEKYVLYHCESDDSVLEEVFKSKTCDNKLQSSTEFTHDDADYNCGGIHSFMDFNLYNEGDDCDGTKVSHTATATGVCYDTDSSSGYGIAFCNATHLWIHFSDFANCSNPNDVMVITPECIFIKEVSNEDVSGRMLRCVENGVQIGGEKDYLDCSYALDYSSEYDDYKNDPMENLAVAMHMCMPTAVSNRNHSSGTLQFWNGSCAVDPSTATLYEVPTDMCPMNGTSFVDGAFGIYLNESIIDEMVDKASTSTRAKDSVHCGADDCSASDYSLLRVYTSFNGNCSDLLTDSTGIYDEVRVVTGVCLRTSQQSSMKSICDPNALQKGVTSLFYENVDCEEEDDNGGEDVENMIFNYCSDSTGTVAYALIECNCNGCEAQRRNRSDDENVNGGVIAAVVLLFVFCSAFVFVWVRTSKQMGECWTYKKKSVFYYNELEALSGSRLPLIQEKAKAGMELSSALSADKDKGGDTDEKQIDCVDEVSEECGDWKNADVEKDNIIAELKKDKVRLEQELASARERIQLLEQTVEH